MAFVTNEQNYKRNYMKLLETQFVTFVCNFCGQALLLLLYSLTTLVFHRTRQVSTENEDDDKTFIDEVETQPLLRDGNDTRQYTHNFIHQRMTDTKYT